MREREASQQIEGRKHQDSLTVRLPLIPIGCKPKQPSI
jgi:hypothetical protein